MISLHHRNDEPNIPGNRLEPRSDKESPKVEITNDEEVEITNVVILVNVNEEEGRIYCMNSYELKRREKGKIIEETPRIDGYVTKITPSSRSSNTKLSHTNRLLSLFKAKPARFKRYKNFFQGVTKVVILNLFKHMDSKVSLSGNTHIKEQVKKQVPEQVRDQVPVYVAEGLILERQKTKEEMERMIAKAILQERGNIQAEISLQIQNAIDNHIPSQVDASVRSYMSVDPQLQQQDIAIWLALQMKFERLQVQQTTCRTSAIRLRDQDDPHDVYDDEIPTKQVSQDIIEEVSLTIDEAKLKKMADEMLRQRYPEAPALSLINQDLLYLKKGSLGPEKIVLSLHKFLVIIFNDDDIEERTSRWVNNFVKKFNPYARYGVEH
ncbi:hypothetical protein Tco_0226905 [Tanacetum coccineum]